MKKILSILTFVFILCGCAGSIASSRFAVSTVFEGGAAEGAGNFVDNAASGEVYEGTGQGYRGPVTIQVRIDGADIIEIVIIDSEEDRFVGGAAMEELIDLVVMYDSTDIDAVSGATESSRGFLEAVESAIMKR